MDKVTKARMGCLIPIYIVLSLMAIGLMILVKMPQVTAFMLTWMVCFPFFTLVRPYSKEAIKLAEAKDKGKTVRARLVKNKGLMNKRCTYTYMHNGISYYKTIKFKAVDRGPTHGRDRNWPDDELKSKYIWQNAHILREVESHIVLYFMPDEPDKSYWEEEVNRKDILAPLACIVLPIMAAIITNILL